ncbi:hypothetical protein lerEdw1_010948 [Lerista edwardsae]|nr:hypothetical protein lerEdw1_010948 [Lerista edwardsae]
MNKWILLSFSVLLFCTVAQGLVCKVCKYKLGNICLASRAPCQAEQGQYCETTDVYAGRFPLFTQYGCGKYSELCNRTEDRDNTWQTRFKRTCCNFDLCNG